MLLAETLSFHRTAEMLHVTQPTLSKLVKEIEEGLGIKLFERSTRMVRLSREGQDILETAKRITALHAKGMQELEQRLRERNNRVALAALPTLAASVIPQVIRNLTARDPRIRVEVFDPVANEALALLRDRRVDIAVTAKQDESAADLVYEELFTEPFVLFHSERMVPSVKEWSPAALAELPLISMPPGTSVRVLTERAFQEAGQPFNPVYSLRDLNTITRFVQGECGVALLPESSIDSEGQRGMRKGLLRGALTRSVGMYVRREYRASALVGMALAELRLAGRDRQIDAIVSGRATP